MVTRNSFPSGRDAQANTPIGFRLAVIGIVTTSLIVALFARLFYLQVIDGPQLAAAALSNKVRTVYEDAPRGRILDRNGIVIVGNREADVITIDRDATRKDKTLLARLATFLSTDVQTLEMRMKDPKVSPYRPAVIATNVDKATVASLRERQGEFPGVTASTRVERWYPNGTLAAQLIGYVGEINDSELAKHEKDNYKPGDNIGKSGIEQAYESDLRGAIGVDRLEVDATGRAVRVLDHSPPVAGRDVQLSISIDVQKAAEDGIAQGLETARGGPDPHGNSATPAPAGSAVAIDPNDGSLLALASYPTYDPAAFVNGVSQETYAALTDPNNFLPLNNRAIQGQYAPGSTFKLVTAIAGVRSGVLDPNAIVVDGGSYVLGNRQYRNAQGKAYGRVDLASSITVSSDVYFYGLGARLWQARDKRGDPMQDVAREMGLGSTQGIEIAGEAPGRVPDPKSRKKMHDENPQAYPEGQWFGGDNVNLAIGQGDTLATPLQIANLYATFANHGTLYKPHLGSKVLDSRGNTVSRVEPTVIRKVDIPANAYDPTKEGLVGAVNDPRGTAYSAFNGFDLKAFPVAGKTGTAQVEGKQDSALFAGYGPIDAPKIAVSVVLEEAGFGGAAAAPVARRIMASYSGQPIEPIKLGNGVD